MEPYVMSDFEKKDLEEKKAQKESGALSFSSWEEVEAQVRLFEQAEKEYQAQQMKMKKS